MKELKETEIHIKDYLQTIWSNIWIVAVSFILVVTVTMIGTFLKVPQYRAVARVEIQARATNPVPIRDIATAGVQSAGYWDILRYHESQYLIIRSRRLIGRVVDHLNLQEEAPYRQAKDPVALLLSKLTVEPIEDTQMVEIQVVDPDPERAAVLANAISQEYLDYNLQRVIETAERVSELLQNKLSNFQTELSQSSKDLYEYAEEESIFIPEDRQRINSNKMHVLSEALSQTQTQRLALEATLRKVSEVERDGGKYAVIPQISDSETLNKLKLELIDMESELAEQRQKYGSNHPTILRTQTQIGRLNKEMAQGEQQIIERLKTEYAILIDRENQYLEALNEVKRESVGLSKKASLFQMLEQDVTSTKDIYNLLINRIKESGLLSGLRSNNVSILDRAEVPAGPFTPNKRLNLLLSVIVGLMLGVGLIFLKEYLDRSIKTPEELEDRFSLNILSLIPLNTEKKTRMEQEAFHSLRTNLYFSRTDRSRNAILVTSAVPREGKTTVCSELAKVLAKAGERVLLLDCDLRRPSVHSRFQIRRERGLTDYLVLDEERSWKAFLKHPEQPNIYIMTAGAIPPNPPDILGMEKLKQLLAEAKSDFDWVLLDSPPVTTITDSILLASIVDMVMFVVRQGEVMREVLGRSLQDLRKVNEHVIGAVLNGVDLGTPYYKKYYYADYYAPHEEGRKYKEIRTVSDRGGSAA